MPLVFTVSVNTENIERSRRKFRVRGGRRHFTDEAGSHGLSDGTFRIPRPTRFCDAGERPTGLPVELQTGDGLARAESARLTQPPTTVMPDPETRPLCPGTPLPYFGFFIFRAPPSFGSMGGDARTTLLPRVINWVGGGVRRRGLSMAGCTGGSAVDGYASGTVGAPAGGAMSCPVGGPVGAATGAPTLAAGNGTPKVDPLPAPDSASWL